MADKPEPRTPSHRAYSVIRREGQDDFWLNIGLVFPHKDGSGFNVILQAIPFDHKVVCRVIDDADQQGDAPPAAQTKKAQPSGQGRSAGRR